MLGFSFKLVSLEQNMPCKLFQSVAKPENFLRGLINIFCVIFRFITKCKRKLMEIFKSQRGLWPSLALWTQWEGVTTQFLQWSKNHIYNILSRNDPFDLTTRDMGSKFRYGFGKVLGTQNRPIVGLTSFYGVLCLNPIKGKLNIAF